MPDRKTYTGSCHCGAVSYEVTTNLASTITCNCSICSRAGWVLNFVPAENFTLLQGEENLTSYKFHKNIIDHLFCKTCGIHSFGRGIGSDGIAMIGVNVRCLDHFDITSITPTAFDGKSR
jgi:hypothetical protein